MSENYLTVIKMRTYDRDVTDFCISEVPMCKEDVKDFVFKKNPTGYTISSQHFIVKSKEIKVYQQPKSAFDEIKKELAK